MTKTSTDSPRSRNIVLVTAAVATLIGGFEAFDASATPASDSGPARIVRIYPPGGADISGGPDSMVQTPTGKTVYTIQSNPNAVSVYNTSKHKVVKLIRFKSYPMSIAISPRGRFVYVALQFPGSLAVINTRTNRVGRRTKLPYEPGNLAISPTGRTLYAASGLSLRLINTVTLHTRKKVSLGRSAAGLCVSSTGRRVYVALDGPRYNSNGWAAVVNTASNKVVKRVPVGVGPNAVALSPDGNSLYVTNGGGNHRHGDVSVISTARLKVGRTIARRGDPYAIAVAPNGRFLYVTNLSHFSVYTINVRRGVVIRTTPAKRGLPYGVVVAPSGRVAYVAEGAGGG